jgi:hypothetical protein
MIRLHFFALRKKQNGHLSHSPEIYSRHKTGLEKKFKEGKKPPRTVAAKRVNQIECKTR